MNRQALNLNLNHNTGASEWHLLAEFSLEEFLSERGRSEGLLAGSLSLSHYELEPLSVWLASWEWMLAKCAKEMWGQSEQGGRVFVFCQRKVIDDGCLERAPGGPDHGKRMNGGWGYYAIEKGRDSTGAAGQASCHIIEIYLYRESIDTP